MWATTRDDLWHVSERCRTFSSSMHRRPCKVTITAMAQSMRPTTCGGATTQVHFGGDPAGYNTWRTNFGRTAGAGARWRSGRIARACHTGDVFAVNNSVGSSSETLLKP